MNENLNIEIISPEKILLSSKINSATIPSFEGEMTILPDHIALITFLRPGIIKINGDKESQYFVEEGTVEFSKNNLTILSSTILETGSLSKEKIEKMLTESKNLLSKNDLNDKSRYIISHKVDCLSRINL
tara:strand:- start:3590 stop:3979 length:390 start_codon:yes stop_codon:yes gene_type:complete